MTNAIKIEGFPAHRLDHARHAVAQAHKRMVRSAERAGQAVPAAPTITVVAERVESRCTGCGCVTAGWAGGTCIACREGYFYTRQVLDLEVVCERPRLAGWDFLAVVEPLEGGNLIRQVPYAEVAEGELAPWREGSIVCDHCRTTRRRHETFVVRADGSDAAIAAGTYKQVGRNCLEAFLGGKSAAAILASLSIEKIVRGEGEEGEGGWGGSPRVLEPGSFMSWTASVVRKDGWVSKGKARETESQSTSDVVMWLENPPHPSDRARWEKAREEYRPTDADVARGVAALQWARSLEPKSDYERNLMLVANQKALQHHHAGILASAVAAHARILGEEVKRAQRGESNHVGTVGEKHSFGNVTIERIASIDTDYGTLHIHTFRDAEGNAIVWRTGEARGNVGGSYQLRGTVKKHSEFRGERQTEVTRCKVEPAR